MTFETNIFFNYEIKIKYNTPPAVELYNQMLKKNLARKWVPGLIFGAGAGFSKVPKKFSHPESHSKISKLMITELFYLRFINTNRSSLHTRNFRRIHFSVFRYR